MSSQTWARKHRAHLERHRPQQVADMAADGTLEEHCEEVGEQVESVVERTRQQLLEANPVPAGADDHERAAHLGMIYHQAWELVGLQIIYPPSGEEEDDARIGENGGYID